VGRLLGSTVVRTAGIPSYFEGIVAIILHQDFFGLGEEEFEKGWGSDSFHISSKSAKVILKPPSPERSGKGYCEGQWALFQGSF